VRLERLSEAQRLQVGAVPQGGMVV
jgi:hypothetical protein